MTSLELKAESQAYADEAMCVVPSYPFIACQKCVKAVCNANGLAQSIAQLSVVARLEGASSDSRYRTCLTNLVNKGKAIHLLKPLAGHLSIQTTTTYLYISPSQLRAVVELF